MSISFFPSGYTTQMGQAGLVTTESIRKYFGSVGENSLTTQEKSSNPLCWFVMVIS